MFNLPYIFAQNNVVVIKHQKGQNLRVNPANVDQLDTQGGIGEFATWNAIPANGGKTVQFKSTKTGKFLRIFAGKKIDVGGTGGPFTTFNVHKADGSVKFESVKFPGQYLAVKPGGIGVGNGGKFTKMQVLRKAGAFSLRYAFAQQNVVVIKHQKGQNLRVNPADQDQLDPNGGIGEFATFTAIPANGKVQFKSTKTGKFIRIINDQIDVGGVGGPWTHFNVSKVDGFDRFESAKLSGKYLAVKPAGIAIGVGGPFTRFRVFRKN